MSESYGALCSEHAINQRLNLKMDLPVEREPVLAMFDRLRKEHPTLRHFKRFNQELVIESDPGTPPGRWTSLRKNSLRSGMVAADSPEQALAFHKLVLQIAPYFLTLSAVEVDYLELMFAFDLLATGNHDAIVHEALFGGSPIARLLEVRGSSVSDCQPIFGIALDEDRQTEAHFEVKTRSSPPPPPGVPAGDDAPPTPISVHLVLRRYGPFEDVAHLPGVLSELGRIGDELVQSRLLPGLLLPIRQAIASHNA
jgi:hypothetical protein